LTIAFLLVFFGITLTLSTLFWLELSGLAALLVLSALSGLSTTLCSLTLTRVAALLTLFFHIICLALLTLFLHIICHERFLLKARNVPAPLKFCRYL
jgi:hypothetical protein